MTYALRNMGDSYKIVIDLETKNTQHGTRRYSSDTGLEYKRRSYAESKAKLFIQRLQPTIQHQYIGIIQMGEYCGEEVQLCELCGDKTGACRFEKACSCWYGVSCSGSGKSLREVTQRQK